MIWLYLTIAVVLLLLLRKGLAADSRNPSGKMSKAQAAEILGVAQDASEETIREAHRKLMKKLHPDQGGSEYLSQQINQAKDCLLKR